MSSFCAPGVDRKMSQEISRHIWWGQGSQNGGHVWAFLLWTWAHGDSTPSDPPCYVTAMTPLGKALASTAFSRNVNSLSIPLVFLMIQRKIMVPTFLSFKICFPPDRGRPPNFSNPFSLSLCWPDQHFSSTLTCLKTIYRKDSILKIPEHGSEIKISLWTPVSEKGRRNDWTLTSSPLFQAVIALQENPQTPTRPVVSWGGRREPKVDI